jgi:hypothetical protein
MKRFSSLIVVAVVATVGAFLWHASVQAEASAPMTEAHIARIRSNCVEAQATLNQLHASDALLRVNRGQVYESISTKLMAPFNSRVALNKLDGVSLIATATNYERQLNDFRTKYQQYEEAMSQVLKINCSNQPVAFYDSVADTHEKRMRVHDSTVTLQKTIQDYKDTFEAFAKRFEENHA